MLLGLLLVSMVLGARGETTINDYLVEINDSALISVRPTARSSEQLNLSGLGLQRIEKYAFANATNIKILNLGNNSIDALTRSAFSSLRNLEHLSLADNAIEAFAGDFAGLDNLKTLNISNNPFARLGPGAFHGLSKTIDIFVRGNSLKTIFRKAFLRRNSLNEMLYDVFAPENSWKTTLADVVLQRDSLTEMFTDFLDLNNLLPQPLLYLIRQGMMLMERFIGVFINPDKLSSLRSMLTDDKDEDDDDDEDQDEDEDKTENEDDDNEKATKSGRALEIDEEPQLRLKVCMNQGKVTIMERVSSNEVPRAGCKLLANNRYGVFIESLGIKEFERGWYRLPNDPQIMRISLCYNEIVHVTEEMLNDLPASVHTVYLMDNRIERLNQGVIDNTNIKWLNLSNNFISEIEENALARTGLQQIYLENNRLTDTRFLATLPPGLHRLSLNGNQIVEFTSDPLMDFRQLQVMTLTDNRIKTLRSNSLKGLEYLLVLDLSRNRIETLEPRCFRGLKSMVDLKLRDNEIGDLDAGVFEDLSQLVDLDLGGNRLTRITEGFRNSLPSSLDSLDLDRNEIESVENGSFGNVPKHLLNLENNRITRIAKGSFVVPKLRGQNVAHDRVDDNNILGPLFRATQLAKGLATVMKGMLLPRRAEAIDVVNLSGTSVRRLENGALSGVHSYVIVERNSIELIQSGLFDDDSRRTR